ncbi:hypothetical protein ATN00_00490 [Sphingobium baderi]|uniref:DUF3325 domain-containing protein n=1 Tax=Sphingobium baderi TaxID=1332080 RepID=A0A0S3EUA7_9SPHN|nr:hypothetical protein ATN00_00490 [Sphingobium baderi]
MIWAFLASAFSAICILILCLGDPKRIRVGRVPRREWRRRSRQALSVAAGIPGLLLALSGDAAAFLVWLGACALCGWVVAVWFSAGRQKMD